MNESRYGKFIWIDSQAATNIEDQYGLVIGEDIAARGGKFLALLKPDSEAIYDFQVDEDGLFDFRIFLHYSATAPDTRVALTVNGKETSPAKELPVTGSLLGRYEFFPAGRVKLPRGIHRLQISKSTGFFHLSGILLVENERFITEGAAEKYFRGEWEKSEHLKLPRPHPMFEETVERSGLPLGGIGSGKVEISPDGVLTNITINNNQDVPIFQAPGCFFALCEKSSSGTVAKTFHGAGGYGLPGTERLRFDGAFPRASFTVDDASFRLSITLRAFSGLVPHNLKDSSLPAASFVFKAENPWDEPAEFSVAFSWENLIGCGGWPVPVQEGRRPQVCKKERRLATWNDRTGDFQEPLDLPKACGIRFAAKSDNGYPLSFGQYVLLVDTTEGGSISRNISWNLLGNEAKDVFQVFAREGKLPEAANSAVIGEEGTYHGAASIALGKVIPPHEERHFVFVFAWYTPNLFDTDGCRYGVYYQNFFKNAEEVAMYSLGERERLYTESSEIERLLAASNLPGYMKRKLCDDMFPLYSSSWFTRDGKFSINEGPTTMGGCYGTLDQRLASHVIYTLFWPELDTSELELFASQQSEEGRVPHDVGRAALHDGLHIDWPEFGSEFVLEIFHYWLWTGDHKFLRKMYPNMKKALLWEASLDDDGDGIPDLKVGRGTTYDTYQWFGASPFVATLYLAALRAMGIAATFVGDLDFARRREELARKVQKSVEDRLFNGHYFISYEDRAGTGRVSRNCFVGQLAGEWFAHLADFGHLLDPDRIRTALAEIYRLNVDRPGHLGIYDEVEPDGKPAWYGYGFLAYAEVYFGCTAIYEGLVQEGLRSIEKAHDISYEINRHPWRTYLSYFGKNGKPIGLQWYMTNPASWFALYALEGFLPDRPGKRFLLDPRLDRLHAPLFSPLFWGWLDYEKVGGTRHTETFRIRLHKEIRRSGARFKKFETYLPLKARAIETRRAGRLVRFGFEPSSGKLILEGPFNLAKKPLVVEVSYEVEYEA